MIKTVKPLALSGEEMDRVESFGERLKREREKQGVSLEDVSAATKISTRMLRALEQEKFDQLPGGIFNKGFVRAYAQQLGMDEDQAVADYLATVGEGRQPAPPDIQQPFPLEVREPKQPREHTAARIPWGALAIVLLLASLGFAVWNFYSNRSTPVSLPVSVAQQPRVPAAKPPNPSLAKPPAAPPGAFTVLIKADEDSWLSIQADGKQLVEETLTAATQKSVSAQREIVVRAGNVGALELFFNGNRLPSQGDYGEVKTLTFDSRGLQAPAAQAAPPPGTEN